MLYTWRWKILRKVADPSRIGEFVVEPRASGLAQVPPTRYACETIADHDNCSEMYEVCRVIRAFDPNYAELHVNDAFIDSMHVITPISKLRLLDGLKTRVACIYHQCCSGPSF